MDRGLIYYLVTSALLAALLFLPASHLVWVLSVRRLERKTSRRLSDQDRRAQYRRARFLAFFLVVVFAPLFNYNIFGIPGR
jgi:hypothetical protein